MVDFLLVLVELSSLGVVVVLAWRAQHQHRRVGCVSVRLVGMLMKYSSLKQDVKEVVWFILKEIIMISYCFIITVVFSYAAAMNFSLHLIFETIYLVAFHCYFFTSLHGMQTQSSDENSVCLSVRLSNTCIVTKWKKAMFRLLYHTKEHLS